jgi:di/tricarboxylate transporter
VALATAMENSGLAAMMAEVALGYTRGLSPVALVTIFYMLTVLVTEVTSSNASAVIMSRVALALAEALGVNARPLLMAVAYSASNNFLSPKDDQTNMMVYGPGGYRYSDYLLPGVPLVVLFWLLSSFLIPLLWSF